MNLLAFFPSSSMAWYMAKTFLKRIFAVLAMLVIILMRHHLRACLGAWGMRDGRRQRDQVAC